MGWGAVQATLRSAKKAMNVHVKDDGQRVLVDRLWPPGVSRERAALDLWLPDVAPSNELRRWFGHRDELWAEFQVRYRVGCVIIRTCRLWPDSPTTGLSLSSMAPRTRCTIRRSY